MTDTPTPFQPGSMRWTVDDAGEYVVVRTEGSFNVDDHRAMVEDVVSRPFWKPGRAAFFDHRALEFDRVGYEVMKDAVDNHRAYDEKIGDGRAAILMSNLADYGVGRIFDGVATQRIQARIRIFTDEVEAREWATGDAGR